MVQLASHTRDNRQQHIGENSCSLRALYGLYPLTDD